MYKSKRILLILTGCLLICLLGGATMSAQTLKNIKVRVLEKGTSLPIPGAYVKYGKNVLIANKKGECVIPKVRGERIIISVKCIGFHEVKPLTYSIKDKNTIIIKMSPDVGELHGVTVVQQKRHVDVLQQTVKLDEKTLERNTSVSAAKLLEKLPGVSVISTGSTIAKPVIQGMHSSRILLINNGVRLESQSWGDDHAPEIDHTASSVIEVIKGAESIRYGYGAVGGVVLFNQSPLPYGHDKLFVSGKINSGYDTNARGGDASGTLDFGWKSLGLRLHGLYQRAGDYTTAEYRLNNTGFNNISMSALLGVQTENITATLFSSLYYSRSGIYYASKISDVNQLITRFEIGRPDESSVRPFSYVIEPPFQQTQHFTLKGDLKWIINPQHDISFKLTYQDNLRQEYENRKSRIYSWLPVQDLQLTTYGADALWNANWNLWNMNSQIGASASYQYNYNVPGTKQPAFIPNYAALTVGYYLVHKAKFGNLQASAGMRYDVRAMDVNGYTSLASFKYYDDFKMFYNFSTSFAAHYQFNENWDARANVGWAWRPPDVNELYATGLSHGIYWVVGNRDLTAERGWKFVSGTRYRTSWYSVEGSIFYQRINNYIYDNIGHGADRFHNHPSGKYPKFIFTQDNTRFYGGDLVATVMPLKGLSINAKGEWIYARNLSEDAWLPFMPSDRYGLDASYNFSFGTKDRWDAGFTLEGNFVTQQTRFDPEKDLIAETPPAYVTFNGVAELKYDYMKGRSVKFMITGDNIFNSLYKEYTDRFRYYAHARGAQFSLRTILNF